MLHADWIETFDSGFDQTGQFSAVSTTGSAPAGSAVESTAGGFLTLSTDTLPSAGGAAFFFGTVNEDFSDLRVRGQASGVGSNDHTNLLLRANTATLSGYTFTVDDRSGRAGTTRFDSLVIVLLTTF